LQAIHNQILYFQNLQNFFEVSLVGVEPSKAPIILPRAKDVAFRELKDPKTIEIFFKHWLV